MTRRWLSILPLVLFLFSLCENVQAQTTAYVGATLVHPEGEAVADGVVLVRDGRIQAAGARADVAIPDAAERVDLTGRYMIPGMVDGHVHFFQSGGLYTRPDALDLRAARPYAEELRRIRARLDDTFRRYLASGITGVVDVGGPMWNLDVRARTDTTELAPVMTTAGPLISSVQPSALTTDDPPILKIDTPEAARAEVQRQVAAGVDLIKIWYIVRGNETPAAFRPVVDATIDEAHAAGLRVAVHATQLETARAAVEAGADVLVHSVYDAPVDDAFVQLLRENDVLYTPTLMVGERYRETFAGALDFTVAEHRLGQKEVIASLFDLYTLPDSLVPQGIGQRLREDVPVAADSVAMRNLKRLHDAGVTIVAGTDAGNIGTPHGPALSREVELMREAGLSPKEILKTATVGGAALLGRDDLGRIAEGYEARLTVLTADPRDDVQNLFAVDRVILPTRTATVDALIPPTPEAAVQQQLNAYNARDLDGFLDAYTPDVAVYAFPDSLRFRGHDAMRAQYGPMFDRLPGLHADVTQRIVQGAVVIDHERVQGFGGEAPVRAVAVYRVNEAGRIEAVWFVQ